MNMVSFVSHICIIHLYYSFVDTSELVRFHLKTFQFTSNRKRSICSCLSINSVAGSNPFTNFNYVLSEMEVAISLMQLAPSLIMLIYTLLMSPLNYCLTLKNIFFLCWNEKR